MNIENQELSLNKLIILFMLNSTELPLTNTKICDFVIGNSYTNYFSLQEFLNQMTESNLVEISNISNITLYQITDEGKKILELLDSHIPKSSKTDIRDFLKNNQIEIKSTLELYSDYFPGLQEDFLVHCFAKDKKEIILEFKITVYNEEYAKQICQNWKERNHIVYKNLLHDLSLKQSAVPL